MSKKVIDLAIDQIKETGQGLRSFITEEKLLELTRSIKKLGVLQPIVVRKKGMDFEIIAGVRRFYAARQLGWPSIPAIVTDLDSSDQAVATLHENIIREDINHMDIARYLRYIKEETKSTDAEIAQVFGYSPAWTSRHFRLLEAPEELQAAVEAGHIDMDSAIQLSRIKSHHRRKYLLKYAIEDGATQLTIRRWVADELGRKMPEPGQSGALDKASPVQNAEKPTFKCFLCGEIHDSNDMIIVRLNSECYQTLKKAVKIDKEGE